MKRLLSVGASKIRNVTIARVPKILVPFEKHFFICKSRLRPIWGDKRRKSTITIVGKVNNDECVATKNTFYNFISPLQLVTRQAGRTVCVCVCVCV